ncbi:hypothetical protein Bpfe_001544 [Biomphalaria pfeifferi]|uniref:Uncharacterized protein n=1 Tax=Biomphalaria pfeifferi TaxID=112525 RepID=A0AAD8FLG4_BIOPF|nr:hypothetical protein Bpfe_001544 [Biomphalaria pfeifferi]
MEIHQKKTAKKQALDQSVIQLGLQKIMQTTILTQSTFEEGLIKMLVEDMEPIAALERSGFREILFQIFAKIFLTKP